MVFALDFASGFRYAGVVKQSLMFSANYFPLRLSLAFTSCFASFSASYASCIFTISTVCFSELMKKIPLYQAPSPG